MNMKQLNIRFEENKTISVIIPTYNRIGKLIKVLPSYLSQKNVREIIIVDDGSTDNTEITILKLLNNGTRIKYIRNLKNLGAPTSRNIGILNSKGSYIFFGEDDLELSRNHLLILLNHLKINKADIIAGRRIWMQAQESKIDALKRANRYKPQPIDYKLITTNCQVKIASDMQIPLIDASMLVRATIFKTLIYDSNYKINAWREETDFQISAGEKGFKLYYCPHTVSYHLAKIKDKGGQHSSSIFKYELNVFWNNYYMTRKHWKYITTHFEVTSLFLYLIRFSSYRLIDKYFIPFIVRFKKLSE